MDIQGTIISAKVVIESLIKLLENENVDISSIKLKISNTENGSESESLSFQNLVEITLEELDEAKFQKVAVSQSDLDPYRTDFEIIEQTLKLVDLLASSTNVYQRDPESKVYPFESQNPRIQEWWRTACLIQELMTNTDPENCDFEEYKALVEAQEQVG